MLQAASSGTNINTSTMTWGYPERVAVNEVGETIEMIYKQTSMITYTGSFPDQRAEERVYKIVYSCKDGKWHKSEPIYGKIVPPQQEQYEFES